MDEDLDFLTSELGGCVCVQLLSKPKFSGVEKIKTIGSTYMAATGLNASPGPEYASQVSQLCPLDNRKCHLDFSAVHGDEMRSYISCMASARLWSGKPLNVLFLAVFQEHDRQYMHIGTMVEFAFALVGKLDVINKHSFNDFRLRVGELFTELTGEEISMLSPDHCFFS